MIKKQINPAIVVAGYNRMDSIVRLMKCLSNATYDDNDITLIISLDHSDMEDRIIEKIQSIGWNHGELVFRTFKERQGLKRHIISCGDLSKDYGAVVVLEDDLYVSRYFYSYIKQMLDCYQDDKRICGVSLYSHSWNGYGNYQFIPQKNEFDIFIGQIGVSWGQCWTYEQWSDFKKWYSVNSKKEVFDNNLPFTINEWGDQSWAKYFYNYMVEQGKYYILPYTSLSTNFSDVGEHNDKASNAYQVALMGGDKKYHTPKFEEAIKYDMFFERILDGIDINDIPGEDICVNVHGFKRKLYGKKYLLTSKKYEDLTEIRSYGLRLRPIEENVINDIPGEDIFLYAANMLGERDIQYFRRTPLRRIEYELYGTPLKRLEDYVYHALSRERFKTVDINAWDLNADYERRQNRIEILIRETPVTGWTWMFHNVSPINEWDNAEYSIEPSTFEKLLVNRLEKGYIFDNIYNVLDSKNDHSIYLTFDDGYMGIYSYVMPICKKYNIPFCVFITVSFIGKENYLNEEEIRELSECNLCTIGSHSLSHNKMRFMSKEEKKRELLYSKYILEGLIRKEVDLCAYPYGSVYAVDKESLILAKEAGYTMAFSTINAHNSKTGDMRFFMPRINVNEKVAKEMME